MRHLVRTFYFRISAVLLLLIIALSVVQFVFFTWYWERLNQEAEQRTNLELASALAVDLRDELERGIDIEALERDFYEILAQYPKIDIYLLDASGTIVVTSVEERVLTSRSVALGPIEALTAGSAPAELPIYGTNPRTGKIEEVFSAAEITSRGQRYYLYLILRTQQFQKTLDVLAEGYTIVTAAVSIAATAALTGALGLGLFFLITRRFRGIIDSMQRIEAGDFSSRSVGTVNDELGDLSRAINRMTDRIVFEMQEKQRSDELRRTLVARVSHDLRGPITSIRGYLETISGSLAGDANLPVAKHVETALQATFSLNELVGDLFELSKLEARESPIDRDDFSLLELAQHVIERMNIRAQQSGIGLKLIPGGGSPFVNADGRLIGRVLENLISNAVRHSPEGSAIEIKVSEETSGVRVSVCDGGAGIAPEHQAGIFDEFYRAPNSASGGSGLGLTIVKKILQAHGSDVELHSELGKGSTFSFVLEKAKGDVS